MGKRRRRRRGRINKRPPPISFASILSLCPFIRVLPYQSPKLPPPVMTKRRPSLLVYFLLLIAPRQLGHDSATDVLHVKYSPSIIRPFYVRLHTLRCHAEKKPGVTLNSHIRRIYFCLSNVVTPPLRGLQIRPPYERRRRLSTSLSPPTATASGGGGDNSPFLLSLSVRVSLIYCPLSTR